MQEEQEDYSASARLNTHERVCAERYGAIISRIGRLETILWAVIGSIFLSFLGILTGLVMDRLHVYQSDNPSMAEPHRPTISR